MKTIFALLALVISLSSFADNLPRPGNYYGPPSYLPVMRAINGIPGFGRLSPPPYYPPYRYPCRPYYVPGAKCR